MKLILSLLLIVFVVKAPVFAQSNGLDLSFGDKGAIEDYPQISEFGFYNVILQHDGKIIADNWRFNPDGSLDPDYKNAADTSLPMAIQSDDKLLCFTSEWFRPKKLMRLLENGAMDTGFGINGFVEQNDSGVVYPFVASKILVQPDDKFLLIGSYWDGQASDTFGNLVIRLTTPNITMRRYLSTGVIDSTFGINGEVYDTAFHFIDPYYALPLDVQDIGLMNDNIFVLCKRIIRDRNHVFKYGSDGKRDSLFGVKGIASILQIYTKLSSMALQNDGKVLLTTNVSTSKGFKFLRLNADGKQDTSIYRSWVEPNTYSFKNCYSHICNDVIVQPDGKIILAGTVAENGEGINKYGVIRLLNDGTVDSSFGEDGTVKGKPVSCPSSELCQLNKSLLQPDGRIICAGRKRMIVRFNPDGKRSFPQDKLFIVYPNPAKDKVYIESAVTVAHTMLSDMAGRIIYSNNDGSREIDLQSLTAGIYILSVTDATNITERFKIVKE